MFIYNNKYIFNNHALPQIKTSAWLFWSKIINDSIFVGVILTQHFVIKVAMCIFHSVT